VPAAAHPDGLTLGPFDIVADTTSIADFAAATRYGGGGVPALYPMAFLGRPDIRAAIVGMLRPGEIPVHEEQSVAIVRPLAVGAPYRLTVDLTRREEPARLAIRATVAHRDATAVATLDTILRLVSGVEAATANGAGAAQQ
jgi:hypothetical protein